jgi:hypothetical protein
MLDDLWAYANMFYIIVVKDMIVIHENSYNNW